MNGVYSQFYNVLVNTYGTASGQPEQITNANYWLAWSLTTFVFLLIFFLILFGVWLMLRSFTQKRRKKEVHYYYHKWGG